jgi:hypothetical protein
MNRSWPNHGISRAAWRSLNAISSARLDRTRRGLRAGRRQVGLQLVQQHRQLGVADRCRCRADVTGSTSTAPAASSAASTGRSAVVGVVEAEELAHDAERAPFSALRVERAA